MSTMSSEQGQAERRHWIARTRHKFLKKRKIELKKIRREYPNIPELQTMNFCFVELRPTDEIPNEKELLNVYDREMSRLYIPDIKGLEKRVKKAQGWFEENSCESDASVSSDSSNVSFEPNNLDSDDGVQFTDRSDSGDEGVNRKLKRSKIKSFDFDDEYSPEGE